MAISPRLLFLSFLGFGLITGLFVGSLGQAMAAPSARNDQHNVLIVLVDDLGAAHPILEAVWLMVQDPDEETWNWMPIYPELLTDIESEFARSHAAFYLPAVDTIDAAALPPMRDQHVRWDEEYWLDATAINALLTAGGAQMNQNTETWQQPQMALYEQVQLISQLCEFDNQDQTLLDVIVSLIPGHIRSEASSFELISRWDAWVEDGGQITCAHAWAN